MMKRLLLCGLAVTVLVAISHLPPRVDAQVKASAGEPGAPMELIIFARFHAREGKDAAVEKELRDVVTRVQREPGCLGIEIYRSTQDSRLFWLHSRWTDEAAFDRHANLPETNQFVERIEPLIDHPFDVNRTHLLFR